MIFTIICILLLITLLFFQRKKLLKKEYQLAENEKIYTAILQNINAYLLLIGKDFTVERTNYYTLTHSSDTGKLKRVGELLNCVNAIDSGECGTHEACKECPVRNAINQSFKQKKSFKDLEASMQLYTSEKGDSVHCEVSVSGSYFLIGSDEKILLTIYDITSLKKIQTELITAKSKAEQSDKLKSVFLANMSHEVRTPLNAILGFSNLLITASDTESRNSYIRIIQDNNDILLKLFNNILDLSKIETETSKFVYSDVDINLLISELQKLYQRYSEHIHIETNLSPQNIIIRTDLERVKQVLSNFLNNALKFTKQGEITIGCKTQDKEIYLYVKDSGIGIPPEQQSQIFKRFVKLDGQKPGAGLGLAICSLVIEKLNGKIGVESRIGEGSTFWFTLPLSQN